MERRRSDARLDRRAERGSAGSDPASALEREGRNLSARAESRTWQNRVGIGADPLKHVGADVARRRLDPHQMACRPVSVLQAGAARTVTTWLASLATFSVTGAAPLAMAHPKRSRLCLYRGQRGEKGGFGGIIANRHVRQSQPPVPSGDSPAAARDRRHQEAHDARQRARADRSISRTPFLRNSLARPTLVRVNRSGASARYDSELNVLEASGPTGRSSPLPGRGGGRLRRVQRSLVVIHRAERSRSR